MKKEGIIIVNKPSGMTSHDVVRKVRYKLGIKRVGHAGTLDPLATGVLIILVGKATKLFDKFMEFDKAYRSTLMLGTKTNSADISGVVVRQASFEHIKNDQLRRIFSKFEGEIEQRPPMFSAVKFNGAKLYQFARQGIEVKRETRKVKVGRLDIEEIKLPEVKFYMECSKGTYVRQLADDIGDELGCGACISQLQRTKVGNFSINDAVDLKDVNESYIQHFEMQAAV